MAAAWPIRIRGRSWAATERLGWCRLFGRPGVIGATVGIDGHLKNLKILSGPPLLQKAALDAARQWSYEPFIQDGEPVEAEIELNVEFHLG